MTKKLLGGFDTIMQSTRIYDLNGELVMADGREVPEEIMETLAIYITPPENEELEFRFFHRNKDERVCECILEMKFYEAFVCGYGATKQEAFEDCVARYSDWKEKYLRE